MNLKTRTRRLAYQESRRHGYGRTASAIKALLHPNHTLYELYSDREFFWEGMPGEELCDNCKQTMDSVEDTELEHLVCRDCQRVSTPGLVAQMSYETLEDHLEWIEQSKGDIL